MWEHFCLSGGDRTTILSKKSLSIVVGQQAIHLLTVTSKIKKPFPWLVVGETRHNILFILGDPFLVGTLLSHWRLQQVIRAKNPCQKWWGSSSYIGLHFCTKYKKP